MMVNGAASPESGAAQDLNGDHQRSRRLIDANLASVSTVGVIADNNMVSEKGGSLCYMVIVIRKVKGEGMVLPRSWFACPVCAYRLMGPHRGLDLDICLVLNAVGLIVETPKQRSDRYA